MKMYLIVSGAIFGLITLAHIWRVAAEGPSLATDPVFIILTLAAASLCLWAVQLIRRFPRP
jgi:hypothetical protein